MTLVSYIVPCRAPGKYLDEAMRSLLAQRHTPLEIILVWDSDDLVPQQPWEADGRVRVVHTGRHVGTPSALNVGIDAARGDFIARLDADDLAIPGRTRAQVAFLRDHPAAVAVGSLARIIDARGSEKGVLNAGTGDVRHLLTRRNPIVHSSLMVRKEILREVSGYNTECTRMQDYELLCRLALMGEVHVLKEPLVKYRVHDSQSSRNTSPFSTYTHLVLRSRRALSKSLGQRPIATYLKDAVWFSVQVLRHIGIRPPNHSRHTLCKET